MPGHETNLGFWGIKIPQTNVFGTFQGVRGHVPQKILKMEPLRLAKNAFPAYSYGHEVR